MKEIWTKEAAEYHGEFVNFDPTIARPEPVQKPHPPIHVGGAFPHGARRAIRYGDGWIPTARGDVAEVLPKFREMAREAGRDPALIEITSFGLGEDLDRVKRLADAGVARIGPLPATDPPIPWRGSPDWPARRTHHVRPRVRPGR
jgi:alkanesulfonate monooxygenase SsuD/methylene tetrahydromethanopterin reductase-like flavin-dependent oxidoreductase (luciferase family)